MKRWQIQNTGVGGGTGYNLHTYFVTNYNIIAAQEEEADEDEKQEEILQRTMDTIEQ